MTHTDLDALLRALYHARRVLQPPAALTRRDECCDRAGDLDELAAAVWKVRRGC